LQVFPLSSVSALCQPLLKVIQAGSFLADYVAVAHSSPQNQISCTILFVQSIETRGGSLQGQRQS
jgi:hypothetical protein